MRVPRVWAQRRPLQEAARSLRSAIVKSTVTASYTLRITTCRMKESSVPIHYNHEDIAETKRTVFTVYTQSTSCALPSMKRTHALR